MQAILLERETRGRIARRTGDENRIARLRTLALQRHADGHDANERDGHRQRAARGVAADQRNAVPPAQIAGGARELRQPGFVGLGASSARAAPQAGSAPMAARSERLTANARCPIEDGEEFDRKVHAFHERVGDHHQLARGRRHDHRAIVADANAHVAALRAEAGEVFADELEFGAWRHSETAPKRRRP